MINDGILSQFPDDFISPKKKDDKWCLEFAKAAWREYTGMGIACLYNGTTRSGGLSSYDVIAAYMEGRQDSEQYLPMMGVDRNSDESWMHIDTTILPVMPMLVRIVTGILDKSDYDVGFFPNDTLATDRKNNYFAKMKARLAMREAITEQAGPEAPAVIKNLGLEKGSEEPADMEELEMQLQTTYKDWVATEWSSATKSVLAFNRGKEIRKAVRLATLYYGVAGVKDYIDSNGSLKCRAVDPRRMVVSFCRKKDFSDARYKGEVLTMTMQDFAQSNQYIDKTELLKLAQGVCGKFGNPAYCTTWNEGKNFRIEVLDLEWPSIHLGNYEVVEDEMGGMKMEERPGYAYNDKTFVRERHKMQYKCKWVIGTEMVWDCGLCSDIKRAKGQLSEVESSFHFYAPMMTDMRIQSIGQMIKPICDQVQWAWLKMQKTIGEFRSKGISINLSGTEGVKLGKGGTADLTPMGVIELFYQGNVHVHRTDDKFDPNKLGKGKPIEVVEGTGMDDIAGWISVIQQKVQMLKSMIVGLNDYTDASTPDSRSLGKTVDTAVMSTNNSLNDIVETDIHLLGRLSESIVIRMQDMVEFGLIDRLAPAIGDNSVKFFKENKDATPADWNIEIRPLPTAQERQQVLTEAKTYVGAGMLEFEDTVVIMSTNDLREAQQIIAWKIKKRKEAKIQESLQLQQQNAQVQSQSAIAVEQERQKTVELENGAKIEVANIQAEASKEVARINAGASMSGKAMTVAGSLEQKSQMAEAA